MDLEEILKEVDNLDRESRDLKEDLLKLCWYMRGGVTIDDVYWMSFEDRQMIASIVKENLETTKKSGLPFFQRDISVTESEVDSDIETLYPRSLNVRSVFSNTFFMKMYEFLCRTLSSANPLPACIIAKLSASF